MANVAHSTLTGSNLHENKGVSAATDDTVATASSSATVWQKLTASHLTGTGNSFGSQLLHVQDQRASGVAADSYSDGLWNTRTLQTVITNEISSASLSSNQISLPAGTYFIDAGCNLFRSTGVTNFSSRLRNITDGSTLRVSLTQRNANVSGSSCNTSFLRGRFTLSGTKTLAIQVYHTDGNAGGGVVVSSGEVEVHSDVLIWKIG